MNKPVTIEMPEEMYSTISEYAADTEMSVEAYLLEVIQQYIQDVSDMEAAEEEFERMEKGESGYTEDEFVVGRPDQDK